MTENEAIKIFKEIYNTDKHTEDEKAESIRIVIDKWNGVYEKISAIDVLFALQYVMDIAKKFESIGTVEEFKALKEKSMAKKPTPIDYEKYIGVIENAKFLRGAYWCPNCKHTVRSGTYCSDCGQKLDWE